MTILTSAWLGLATMVVAVAELLAELGSPTVLETLGELVMVVPEGVTGFTLTTKGKLTEAPEAMVWPPLRVQVKVPVPPTGMEGTQVQLAGVGNETRVVFAGMVSVKVALVSAMGPLLVTDWV